MNPTHSCTSIRPRRAVEALVPTIYTTPGNFGVRAGSCFFFGNDCATPNLRLARVQDPFGNLLAKAKGSVLVSVKNATEASKEEA